MAKAVAIVESFSDDRRDDPAVFDRLAKKFASFSTEELQFLIAENLQSQLAELVYATQVIHDQNVLTAPKDQVRKRIQEAKNFTFTDYNEKIGLPLWRRQAAEPQVDLESFIKRGSLEQNFVRLRGNSRVRIMHNVDDPLANRKSIEELKEALGDQVTLYLHGGHLGNLWFPENKEYADSKPVDLKSTFSPLRHSRMLLAGIHLCLIHSLAPAWMPAGVYPERSRRAGMTNFRFA